MTDPGSWEFTRPARFTVGAVGEPGARVFYFQAFAEGAEVNAKCEKQQAAALAEHLLKLTGDLPEPAGSVDEDDADPVEALPPTDIAFIVGSISLGVDKDDARLVVLLEELPVDPDDGEPIERDPSRLRVHLDRDQVVGLIAQVRSLLGAGRPLCRLCDQPIDPEGHACPRLN